MVIDERHMRRNRPQQMNLHTDRQLQRLEENYLRSLRQQTARYTAAFEDKQDEFAASRLSQLERHQDEREVLASEHASIRRWLREEHAKDIRRMRRCFRGHYLRRKEEEAGIRYREEKYEYESEFKSKKYEMDLRQRSEITFKFEIQHGKQLELLRWHMQQLGNLREQMFEERNRILQPWLRS